ncbi:restriction endonuclease subunit S [Vibrio fluvialis]|uniref:restriction endonuclease subunit S n=1 Tax=Vibrio fluvialis TaxID=676 RepID=UPI001EEB0BA2|nr:restriction endonuclease subunit S [Vibrio fluvialis]
MSEVEATLLPKSWIILPLSEVIQIQKGKKPHDLGDKSNLRTIPYINIKAFEKGIVTEYAPEQDAVYCTEKDVLLVWDGARAGLSGRGVNGYVGSTLVKVTSDIVEMNYLSYYFESIYSILNTQTKGVGIPHINPVVLNNLPFNLAPENEQTRIVDKLEELFSELDAGVKELKAAQTKLSQYRQSLLKSAVEGSLTQQWRAENSDQVQETGEQLLARILKQRREQWQQQKLAEFAEKGKTPPKNWQDKYPEPVQPDTTDLPELPEGWVWASVAQLGYVQLGRQRTPSKMKGENPQKYIRAANITEQGINFNDVLEMDFTEKEIPIYQLKTGDLLLTEASGSPEHVGRPCIWPDVDGVYCFQNTVIRFQPSVISADFSFFIFYAYQKLGKYIDVSGGVGINHLSAGKFSKIAVPLPPLVEQGVLVAEITAELDAIDRQTEATVLGLKQAEAQRKNILKSAFSGQLVPQEPNDEHASVLLEKIKQEREALEKLPKPRKPSKPKKKADLMNTLLEVLTAENNWIDAQDAFQKCGIVDGTSTDRVEEIYTELRRLEKAGKIQIQRKGDFDQLKLIKQDVKDD